MESCPTEYGPEAIAVSLASSSNGRLSGKPWKARKSATVCVQIPLLDDVYLTALYRSRSNIPEGVKTKKWEDRMEKTKKATAIKKLQNELKDEKLAEITRCVLCACSKRSY
jgi:rRNA-processing protein CGR1